jgi:hypothetical protein
MTELDDETRARLALIAGPAALTATGLEIEDLADADARSIAIRADHPELAEALADGHRHVTVAGESMNSRLHLAMHEVVAAQVADHDPPEVYETARRLLDAGYERHEVLHMLARPIVSQIRAALTDKQPYAHARHVAALRALPARGEPDRTQHTFESARRHRSRARDRRR